MDVYEPIPQYSNYIHLGIFVPGTAAMILGVIAEHHRVKNQNVPYHLDDATGYYVCEYPKHSQTMALSLAAVGLVLLGYCIAIIFSGVPFVGRYGWVTTWQRIATNLTFFATLVMIGCTIGLFVGAAVAEVRHEAKDGDLVASVSPEDPTQTIGVNTVNGGPNCRNGKEGLTGGAGILAFCLVVFEIMYYQLMLYAKGFYAHLVVVDDHKLGVAESHDHSSSVPW